MKEVYVIGLCRVWNQKRIIREVLDKAREKCDWLVLLNNQPTDETKEIVRAFAAEHENVSLIDYDGKGIVHESAERMALYHIGRAIADANAKAEQKQAWFYTFDSDEILDCTREELEQALKQARTACLTVRLYDFWPRYDQGETDGYDKIEDARGWCEPNYRDRPYFYKHAEDSNIQWHLVPDRFHSCTMVMSNWSDHHNPWITTDSGLYVKHFGNAIDEEKTREKFLRYKSFREADRNASRWLEALPGGGKNFKQPRTVPYADIRSGNEPSAQKPLAGR